MEGILTDKYITDERTGWKYELVGDYYLPIGTRFEDADPDTVEGDKKSAACTPYTPSGIPTTPEAPRMQDAASEPASVAQNMMPDRPAIGRFGRAHAVYLKHTQRHVYSQLVAEGRLGAYLTQIDEQANSILDLLIRQMSEREGVTEQLKAADQMEWVRRMNSIRNRAEEVMIQEMIYW